MPDPLSNPFATRHIRPGGTPYLYGDDSRLDLVNRFDELGRRCQIRGRHGSGKSSLVLDLLPTMEVRFACQTRFVVFSQSQRAQQNQRVRRLLWDLVFGSREVNELPATPTEESIGEKPRRAAQQLLLAIDGYEQLNHPSRWLLRAVSRLTRTWLIVTTHGDVGLPTLTTTQVELVKARRIIVSLVGGEQQVDALVSGQELKQQLAERNGNLREVLFWLYDRWAQLVRNDAG